MTELKRIMVDGDLELAIYETAPHLITVWVEPRGEQYKGICIGDNPTELEALVTARVALFKLYKACSEPPRNQPNPLVEDAKA